MSEQLPPRDAWVDDRAGTSPSPVHGIGLFAQTDLPRGIIIVRLGGLLVDTTELTARFDAAAVDPDARYIDCITVYDDSHLVMPPGSVARFANHSCDPNLWLVGPYELHTLRTVRAGEELTVDYGTFSGADGFAMKCSCGSSRCRGEITSEDWSIPELQVRYRDHWTPALRGRIDRQRSGRQITPSTS